MNIDLRSYAKINLTLDVRGVNEDGMHLVEMVMQQILLCDDVAIKWDPHAEVTEGKDGLEINLKTNRKYLPTDERNLAYQAAVLMKERYGGKDLCGRLDINIRKRIPVAAGLAGGSGNGAAVIHGLNILWGLDLSLRELCAAGAALGSDVPFCIMGQAAENKELKERFAADPLASHCALATGTGTTLEPIKGLKSHLVLSKPAISVSTAKAYQGIDRIEITERPNTQEMIDGLKTRTMTLIEKNMINVLENYTLMEYPTVVYTKNKMEQLCGDRAVLMSGSGPTVYGLTGSIKEARSICDEMKKINRESFWTRTTY